MTGSPPDSADLPDGLERPFELVSTTTTAPAEPAVPDSLEHPIDGRPQMEFRLTADRRRILVRVSKDDRPAKP
jgi:hypothetical protein